VEGVAGTSAVPAAGNKLVVDPAVVMCRDISDALKVKARLKSDTQAAPVNFAGVTPVYAPPRCSKAVLEHRTTCRCD